MADLRGKRGGFAGGHEIRRNFYRETLKVLDLGLETRLKDSVSLLSGGQRQSLTLLMATLSLPNFSCWTSTPLRWIQDSPARHRVDGENRQGKSSHTVMVTHNMQQAIRYGTA